MQILIFHLAFGIKTKHSSRAQLLPWRESLGACTSIAVGTVNDIMSNQAASTVATTNCWHGCQQ